VFHYFYFNRFMISFTLFCTVPDAGTGSVNVSWRLR